MFPAESAMANGTNAFSYLNEGIAFLSCYAYVRLQEGLRPHQSLTGAGHLNHYIVEPLFRWHGENNRILNSPSVGNVGVIERNGSTRSVVNVSPRTLRHHLQPDKRQRELP